MFSIKITLLKFTYIWKFIDWNIHSYDFLLYWAGRRSVPTSCWCWKGPHSRKISIFLEKKNYMDDRQKFYLKVYRSTYIKYFCCLLSGWVRKCSAHQFPLLSGKNRWTHTHTDTKSEYTNNSGTNL